MTRYAPLPAVSIDPRNESQLVQAAAQTVYEASNKTLNDFSAGNPLAVLLEGQAFAQGEFLYWANQLPQKILIEWIGPFLGAMRRLGTPATAQILVSIAPASVATTIPAGTTFSTNSQLTGGISIPFVSLNDLVIPAGESTGKAIVYSKFVGSANNVPAGSITVASNTGTITYSCANPQPAAGGSDIETFQEVQERFFTLIRRPNPVSETDWQDLFVDLYGSGTLTSIQPNRSSVNGYNYYNDYMVPNGNVSFFVLGPEGTELTQDQLKVGQNVVNFSVPVENKGHLFPITLSQVQYDITLEVDANGTFGSDYKESSLNFRDRLFAVLRPGTTFPADVNPTVSDVDAAFYNTFDASTIFKDPLITRSRAYNTPNSLSKEAAIYTRVYNFEPSSNLISENDLVVVETPNPVFYPAESSFTPYSINKFDQTIYQNLSLKQIKLLAAGNFSLGDVVYYDGAGDISQKGLHVVLENISIASSSDALASILSGKVSTVKQYQPWIVGNTYQYELSGTINPDIIEYDYDPGEFTPATPSNVPLSSRPGAFAWLVTKNFTLQPSTNDVTGAQTENLLGPSIVPSVLVPGSSYIAGTWVCTPLVGGGPNAVIDPYYNYVDIAKGAIVKYAYVNASFTYEPDTLKTSEYFDILVSQGTLSEVLVLNGNEGLPIYKYRARFRAGQYLEYKVTADADPSYYIAAKFFSPESSDINDLLSQGLVYNLAPTPELMAQLLSEQDQGVAGKIASIVIADPGILYTDGVYTDVPVESNSLGFNATLDLTIVGGSVALATVNNPGQGFSIGDVLTVNSSYIGVGGSGVAITVASLTPTSESTLKPNQRMFTFFAGDRTFFRSGNEVTSYTATSAVTPLFDFSVYYENGVFVKSPSTASYLIPSSDYIPFYNPVYDLTAEDTILSEDGRNFYRVMRAFTPTTTVTSWTGLTENNTTRFEEYAGNLLRYVSSYSCEEPILPQSGKETSSIKLGIAQITIVPKSTNRSSSSSTNLTYVWENTATLGEDPQLSWYTSTTFPYSPPNYRSGTLAL